MATRAAPKSTPTVEFGATVGSHSGSNDNALGLPRPSDSPPPAYTPLSDAAGTVELRFNPTATASTITVNNPPPAILPPNPSRRAWNNLNMEPCGEGEHQFRKAPTGNAFIYAVVFFPFGLLFLCWNRKNICKRCGCRQDDSVALQDITSPRRHPRNHTNGTAS